MKLGNNTISKVLRGSTQIQKVFRGTQLIWENWKNKINGYAITWVSGASGYYYSNISPTGFKPQTIYWNIQVFNGNAFGFSATSLLYGQRKSDGVWEQIGSFTWSIGANTLQTFTTTNSVIAGKENVIYTRLYAPVSNRDGVIKLATYMER